MPPTSMLQNLVLQRRPFSKPLETLNRLPALVNGPCKIIDSIEWYRLRATDPGFFHAHAHLTDYSTTFFGRPQLVPVTGGTALEPEPALAKAIGEAVERHCASFYDPSTVVHAAYADLGDHAVDPRRFVQWSEEQYATPGFPYARPDERAVIGWVSGWSLTRSAPVLVPASLVHVTYVPRTAADVFELAPVSGYAAGITREEAILSGILEVVERDAFVIFWRNRLPVPGFDLASFTNGGVRQTLMRFARSPVRLLCSRLTTDIGIPVAFAVLKGTHPTFPAAMIGASANLDEERAIEKALQESAMVHLLTRTLYESPYSRRPIRREDVRTQEDHALYFAARENLPLLDTILRPRSMVASDALQTTETSDDVADNIATCVNRLAACGLETIVVDITLPAMAQLGFTVVKVLVPGAQPLDFGMHDQHLNGSRQYESPVRMSYRTSVPDVSELNFEPHPFP